MSALFDFQGLLVVVLLSICTCSYLRSGMFSGIILRNGELRTGIGWDRHYIEWPCKLKFTRLHFFWVGGWFRVEISMPTYINIVEGVLTASFRSVETHVGNSAQHLCASNLQAANIMQFVTCVPSVITVSHEIVSTKLWPHRTEGPSNPLYSDD